MTEQINTNIPCPHGGTAPSELDSIDRGTGHHWDGGFHHCECGAIIAWTKRPVDGGVVEPHDQPGQLKPRPDQHLASYD